jgi:hypothetical protein
MALNDKSSFECIVFLLGMPLDRSPATQSFLARRLPAAVGSGGQIKFAAKKRESSAYGVEAFDAKKVSTHWAHWMT